MTVDSKVIDAIFLFMEVYFAGLLTSLKNDLHYLHFVSVALGTRLDIVHEKLVDYFETAIVLIFMKRIFLVSLISKIRKHFIKFTI